MVALTARFKQVIFAGGCICTLAGVSVLWKDLVKGKELSPQTPKNLEGKVFLVTGANSGIGREVTKELAKRKAKVFMLCRDMVKCETARKEIVLSTRNKFVYCRLCDLASNSSIRDFVDTFKKSQDRIDGLVNNAGVMNAPRSFSQDGVEIHWASNHLGHFLLTNLLLELLKSSSPSRIVFLMNPDYRKANIDLTDLNLEKHFNKAAAFSQSQLANMLLVRELSERLKGQGVTCNAVYPGVVSGTGIKRHMGVAKSMTGKLISQPLLWVATKPADRAAQTVLHALLSPEVESISGKLFSNMEEREIDEKAQDKILAKKLFLVDEYWSGLKTKEELKVA